MILTSYEIFLGGNGMKQCFAADRWRRPTSCWVKQVLCNILLLLTTQKEPQQNNLAKTPFANPFLTKLKSCAGRSKGGKVVRKWSPAQVQGVNWWSTWFTWLWARRSGWPTLRMSGFSSESCLPMHASLNECPRRLSLRAGVGEGGVRSRS